MDVSSLKEIAAHVFREQPQTIFLPSTAVVVLSRSEAKNFAMVSREHALYYRDFSQRSFGFNRLTFQVGREIMDDLSDILMYLSESSASDEITFRPSKIEVTFICDMVGIGRYSTGELQSLWQRLLRAINLSRKEHCLLDHLLCHEYIYQLFSSAEASSEL